MAYNFERLIIAVPDEDSAIDFLNNVVCFIENETQLCGHEMRVSSKIAHGSSILVWRCINKPCKMTKGLRIDTWYSNFN